MPHHLDNNAKMFSNVLHTITIDQYYTGSLQMIVPS
jgi:hypothetical protein